jgi:hypothetical protein
LKSKMQVANVWMLGHGMHSECECASRNTAAGYPRADADPRRAPLVVAPVVPLKREVGRFLDVKTSDDSREALGTQEALACNEHTHRART